MLAVSRVQTVCYRATGRDFQSQLLSLLRITRSDSIDVFLQEVQEHTENVLNALKPLAGSQISESTTEVIVDALSAGQGCYKLVAHCGRCSNITLAKR